VGFEDLSSVFWFVRSIFLRQPLAAVWLLSLRARVGDPGGYNQPPIHEELETFSPVAFSISEQD